MSDLRKRTDIAARALEFLILTAARTGEVIGATWDEIDLETKLWKIAGARMKRDKPHEVPLSEPALEVVHFMASIRQDDRVFPIGRTAMRLLLRELCGPVR